MKSTSVSLQRNLGEGRYIPTNLEDAVSSTILEKYSCLKNIDIGKKFTNEWEDRELYRNELVDLMYYRKLKIESQIFVLETALSSTIGQVSARTVGCILSCAWGLSSCRNVKEFCFQMPVRLPKEPTDILSLEKPAAVNGKIEYVPKNYGKGIENIEYRDRWMRSGTYLCASLLRLVVMDEDNYMRAWERICNWYRSFYREEICIRVAPRKESIKAIRILLQSRKVLKGTIAAFLLAHKDLEGRNQEMCTLLYEGQMCYTGMHAYRLIIFLTDKLKTPLHIFISLLEHPASRTALETIVHILSKYEFPGTAEQKAVADKATTWRYARIFNSEVFGSLQTKNCQMLVAILALIAEKIGGDVAQFKQLANYISNQRTFLEDVAANIIEFCQKASWEEHDKISGQEIMSESTNSV